MRACADCLAALQDIPPATATLAVVLTLWSALARHANVIAWAKPAAAEMLDRLDAETQALLRTNNQTPAFRAYRHACHAMPPHGFDLARDEFLAFGLGSIDEHTRPYDP